MPAVQKFRSRPKWLEARKKGIGASDSPSILGASPWGGPLSIWETKVGPLEETEEMKEFQEWGHHLERPIAEQFAKKHDRELDIPGRRDEIVMYQSDEIPFILSTPDGFQTQKHRREPGTLQIKTTNQFLMDHWKDGIPLYYQIQCQQELYVTEKTWGSIACLIGGQKMVSFDFERNDKFINAMILKLREFWEFVKHEIPPGVTLETSGQDKLALARLHPKDNGESIELSPDFVHISLELAIAKQQKKAIEEEIDHFENQIKKAIGDNTFGVLTDGTEYSWKHQSRKGFVVDETEFRILRRKGK